MAEFLGWTSKAHKDRLRPNSACETAFRAIDMIDKGFLNESVLKGMSRAQMGELVKGQWKIYQSEIQLAEHDAREASVAKDRAELATTPVERQRLKTHARDYSEQAEQHTTAAKTNAVDFADKAKTMYGR